jgi:hypothetical protein
VSLSPAYILEKMSFGYIQVFMDDCVRNKDFL